MTPQIADPFAGHLPKGDPRGPIFGSGGCNWPTVPGWRLFLGSTTAWGVLSFFNTVGILLEVHEPHGNPNAMQWDIHRSPATVLSGVVLKQRFTDPLGYAFSAVFLTVWGPLETDALFAAGKCNRDHALPEATVTVGVPIGGTGTDFKVRQVKWNEDFPPDWPWPPA
jgi:hypothetical protein